MDLNSVLTYLVNAVSLYLPGLLDRLEEKPVSYEGAQVWRTKLRSRKDFEMIRELAEDEDMQLWKLTKKVADYLVSEESRLRVHRGLRKKRLDHIVLIMNVQRKIDATKSKPLFWTNLSLRKGHRLNFQSYPTLEVINEFVDHVGEQYRSLVRVSDIGRSVEDRPIKMMRISNGNPRNKVMLLVGGQHAREWVSITSPLYIANNIITKYDQQPNYMKNKDWYIIPVLNPDGYVHTHTTDRLWRKNRRVTSDAVCPGVDLNRNFAKSWDVPEVTSHEPCNQDYAGAYPLSEPETMALVRVLNNMGGRVPSAFMDFHSYGQMIMYPWAAGGNSPHANFLNTTAQELKQVIAKSTGRTYDYGTPSDLLYAASGSAMDYFHSKGVRLSYAFEGRDTLEGEHGFLLPPYQIEPTAKEMLAAVRTIANIVDGFRRRATRNDWF